jgi:hypothetical protein
LAGSVDWGFVGASVCVQWSFSTAKTLVAKSARFGSKPKKCAVSDEMRDPKSKRTMHLIGASYDVMADRLETTAAHLSLAKTG